METTKQKSLLQHLDEFETVLKSYKPSPATIKTLQSIPLVLMVGPTASGRNTLINILVKTGHYYYMVSSTTRSKRANNGIMEQDGVEYWFKNEASFLRDLKAGEFLEAAVIHRQQVSGVHVAQLKEAATGHKIAINEVEISGGVTLHAYKPDTLCVFLLPPTFDVWMQRLQARGHMSDDEVRRRLQSAVSEISLALSLDYYQFVVNYEIHEAAEAVDELANGRSVDNEKQQRGRDHAEQLLIDIRLFLEA